MLQINAESSKDLDEEITQSESDYSKSENSSDESFSSEDEKPESKVKPEADLSSEESASEDEKMPTEDAPKTMVKTAHKRKAERSFEGSLSEDEEPPKKSAISPGVKQPHTGSNSSEDEEKSKPKIAQKNDKIAPKKLVVALKPKMKESNSSEDEEEPAENKVNLTDTTREGSSPMKVSIFKVFFKFEFFKNIYTILFSSNLNLI